MQQFIKLFIFMSLFGSSSVLGQNTHMSIVGKSYTLGDSSLVIRSLTFINDSICHYKHQFFIDIDSAYRECLIVCEYKTDENKIIINSQEYPDFLNKKTQVTIPNYWNIMPKYFSVDSINLYDSILKKKDKDNFSILSFLELYYIANGFIDRPINDTIFWFDDCLLYNKSFEVVSKISESSVYTFYDKYIFINNKHSLSLKQKLNILTSKEANSVVNGLPKNQIIDYVYKARLSNYNKAVSDNYIVKRNYKWLRRFFRKYKINKKEQQRTLYDYCLFLNLT